MSRDAATGNTPFETWTKNPCMEEIILVASPLLETPLI
jgi:hypothetical protein